jgi:hypothetical protein
MKMTGQLLLEDAWYALEQCGLLLSDAVMLFEGGRHATASGMAMPAREELGKARLFLTLRDRSRPETRSLLIRSERVSTSTRRSSGSVVRSLMM